MSLKITWHLTSGSNTGTPTWVFPVPFGVYVRGRETNVTGIDFISAADQQRDTVMRTSSTRDLDTLISAAINQHYANLIVQANDE